MVGLIDDSGFVYERIHSESVEIKISFSWLETVVIASSFQVNGHTFWVELDPLLLEQRANSDVRWI